MINERLIYLLENKNMTAPYQSGFRKKSQTIDPAVCLGNEVRKAQVNKKIGGAVFFYVTEAYGIM